MKLTFPTPLFTQRENKNTINSAEVFSFCNTSSTSLALNSVMYFVRFSL